MSETRSRLAAIAFALSLPLNAALADFPASPTALRPPAVPLVDNWLRRRITLPDGVDPTRLQFLVYHDEDAEVYLDGVLAVRDLGYLSSYDPLEIRPVALAGLRPGKKVVMAVHCHQTKGGQGIDVGLTEVVESTR